MIAANQQKSDQAAIHLAERDTGPESNSGPSNTRLRIANSRPTASPATSGCTDDSGSGEEHHSSPIVSSAASRAARRSSHRPMAATNKVVTVTTQMTATTSVTVEIGIERQYRVNSSMLPQYM